MLRVYFEELSRYHAKQNKDMKARTNSGSRNGSSEEITEWELKDDDWDNDDWSNLVHDDQLRLL